MKKRKKLSALCLLLAAAILAPAGAETAFAVERPVSALEAAVSEKDSFASEDSEAEIFKAGSSPSEETSSAPTLEVSLTDGATVRNDRMSFEVTARGKKGEKIPSYVTLNGEPVGCLWDDGEKTGYTLAFSEVGRQTVTVSASSEGEETVKSFTLFYRPAKKGERIGTATVSVEVFSLGCGYLIPPVSLPILAGENAAQALVRLLCEEGLVCYFGGEEEDGFYLAYIADGGARPESFNGYLRSREPKNPRALEISPAIPEDLTGYLEKTGEFYGPDDYEKNWQGFLGEFVFAGGAGWMYSLNNRFPNVSLSDSFLSEGDVMRVQFTLAYGADIGGGKALGTGEDADFYPVANRDSLTKTLEKAMSGALSDRGGEALREALAVAGKLNASQEEVDGAERALREALEKSGETEAPESGENAGSGTSGSAENTGNGSSGNTGGGTSGDAGPTESAGNEGNAWQGETTGAFPSSPSESQTGEGSRPAPDDTEAPSEGETPSEPEESRPGAGGNSSEPEDGEGELPSLLAVARGIVEWKKRDLGLPPDGGLLEGSFLSLAGSTAGDWYPIALSLLGLEDNFPAYLSALREAVEKRYRTPGRLSSAKATEWHRISLAVLAAGGDPTSFGRDENGELIDLIADGTYERGRTASLGKQGINGWIWGLITIDAKGYEVPDGAFTGREDMIEEILSRQLPDGGWALSGSHSDPDLTAMALQALAPYAREVESRVEEVSEETADAVKKAVDRALTFLSESQLPTGDFESWGTRNCESTAQGIIALCCLGLDPLTDSRFVKEGKTLLDGLLLYRRPDGGFAHSYEADPNNPGAMPAQSDSMAGEQALLALAALIRRGEGKTSLYDFRTVGIDVPSGTIFTEEDRRAVEALPDRLTTAQYGTVLSLLEKLNRAADFPGREAYLARLEEAKAALAALFEEIEAIGAAIERLPSPEALALRDGRAVEELLDRVGELSEADREKIEGLAELMEAEARIKSLRRELVLGVLLSAVFLLLTGVLVLRFIGRRRERAARRGFSDPEDSENGDG